MSSFSVQRLVWYCTVHSTYIAEETISMWFSLHGPSIQLSENPPHTVRWSKLFWPPPGGAILPVKNVWCTCFGRGQGHRPCLRDVMSPADCMPPITCCLRSRLPIVSVTECPFVSIDLALGCQSHENNGHLRGVFSMRTVGH